MGEGVSTVGHVMVTLAIFTSAPAWEIKQVIQSGGESNEEGSVIKYAFPGISTFNTWARKDMEMDAG